MANIEKRFEPKFGTEKKEEAEKEKPFTLTVATKEGDFSFEEIPFEKLGIDKKVCEGAFNRVGEIAEEENRFFKEFSGKRNLIEEIIADTTSDNYFTPERSDEELRAIKFPAKNNEILKATETTKSIVRHEAFHWAMRLESSEGVPFWLEMQENIEQGKDTKLPFLEKEVKTSRFKEFAGFIKGAPSFLEIIVYGAHPETDIRELIEEKLADFHMISQEISKNGLKRGAEIVTQAKLESLDIIAKNKGLKSYKELPSSTESYYGLVNGRNTLITLKELNEKAGNLSKVRELEGVIKEYENKIQEYIKGFRATYYAEVEVMGYEKKEDYLDEMNKKFLKSFDEILR